MAPVYLYKHTNDLLNEFCGGNDGLARGQFEIEQKITENPLTVCPRCSTGVQRLIAGAVAHKFKGGSPTPKHYG